MTDDEYQGIPLHDLRIDSVEWRPERAEHIRTRTRRYPDRSEFDVEPEWATEAALDPRRIVATTGGASIEVIGWSVSAPARDGVAMGRLLKVWVVPKDLTVGAWDGASACSANRQERKAYKEHEDD